MDNPFIDSFNGSLRDEQLNTELFFSVADMRAKFLEGQWGDKEIRPHVTLGQAPPGDSRPCGNQPASYRAKSSTSKRSSFGWQVRASWINIATRTIPRGGQSVRGHSDLAGSTSACPRPSEEV
jgi:hypothetical protein